MPPGEDGFRGVGEGFPQHPMTQARGTLGISSDPSFWEQKWPNWQTDRHAKTHTDIGTARELKGPGERNPSPCGGDNPSNSTLIQGDPCEQMQQVSRLLNFAGQIVVMHCARHFCMRDLFIHKLYFPQKQRPGVNVSR